MWFHELRYGYVRQQDNGFARQLVNETTSGAVAGGLRRNYGLTELRIYGTTDLWIYGLTELRNYRNWLRFASPRQPDNESTNGELATRSLVVCEAVAKP